tara:strand:+ start:614 stop:2389 length:1776 start_codon:yes stop_codon:yes gene_type:complete
MGIYLGTTELGGGAGSSGGVGVNQYDAFVVSPIGPVIRTALINAPVDYFVLSGLILPDGSFTITYSYFDITTGAFLGTFTLDNTNRTANTNAKEWLPQAVKGVALVPNQAYFVSYGDNGSYVATTPGYNFVSGLYTPPNGTAVYARTGTTADASSNYPNATVTGLRSDPIVQLVEPNGFTANTANDDSVRYCKHLDVPFRWTKRSSSVSLQTAGRDSFLQYKASGGNLADILTNYSRNAPSVGPSDNTKLLFSITPYTNLTTIPEVTPAVVGVSDPEVHLYAPEAITSGGVTNNRWHMLDWGFVADRIVAIAASDTGTTAYPITLQNVNMAIISWPLSGGVARVDKVVDVSNNASYFDGDTLKWHHWTLLINQTTRRVNATYYTPSSSPKYGAGALEYSADGGTVTEVATFTDTSSGMTAAGHNVFKGLTEFDGQWIKLNRIGVQFLTTESMRALKFGDSNSLPTSSTDWSNVWGDMDATQVGVGTDITTLTNFGSALTNSTVLRAADVTSFDIGGYFGSTGLIDVSTFFISTDSSYLFGVQGAYRWPVIDIQVIGDPIGQIPAQTGLNAGYDDAYNAIPSLVQTVFVKIN